MTQVVCAISECANKDLPIISSKVNHKFDFQESYLGLLKGVLVLFVEATAFLG